MNGLTLFQLVLLILLVKRSTSQDATSRKYAFVLNDIELEIKGITHTTTHKQLRSLGITEQDIIGGLSIYVHIKDSVKVKHDDEIITEFKLKKPYKKASEIKTLLQEINERNPEIMDFEKCTLKF
uniref:Uncharacterized protein n=1 Tax=Ditylenchus dipsaci TaxID=166011 RepID=A0A915E0F8_9BILA